MSEITKIVEVLGNNELPLGKLFRTTNPEWKAASVDAMSNFYNDIRGLEQVGLLILQRKDNSEPTVRMSPSGIGIDSQFK
jgi:hypothetical protein